MDPASVDDRIAIAKHVLSAKWGFPAFRGVQEAAVRAVLGGQDAFVLMPTGGGKSLCYALPSEVLPGVVLVVSPLIALMQDQVDSFKAKGVDADFISSTRPESQRRATLERLAEWAAAPQRAGEGGAGAAAAAAARGRLQLLYVTPELIGTQAFMSVLVSVHRAGGLALLAVDEAHCISSWGHDFRPAYRQLSQMRRRLPGVPIMALTATAAQQVREDIVASLGLSSPRILTMSFNRPNITYDVCYLDALRTSEAPPANGGGGGGCRGGGDAAADSLDEAAHEQLMRLLRQAASASDAGGGGGDDGGDGGKWPSGIVYCLKRSSADEVAARLLRAGVPAAAYHAKLPPATRAGVLADWSSGRVAVVAATVAFGMGVDKADVRLVVHWDLPKTLEGFYQESGRAGRDGAPSRSVVIYTRCSRSRMEFILRKEDARSARKKQQQQQQQNRRAPTAATSSCDAPSPAGGAAAGRGVRAFGRVVEMVCGSACRRRALLAHFGEEVPPGGGRQPQGLPCCDCCSDARGVAAALELLRSLEAAPWARGRGRHGHGGGGGGGGEGEAAMPWELRGGAGGDVTDDSDATSSGGEGGGGGGGGGSGSDDDTGAATAAGGGAAVALRRSEAAERRAEEAAAQEADPTLRRMLLQGAAAKRQRVGGSGGAAAAAEAQTVGAAQRSNVVAALGAAIAANPRLACSCEEAAALAKVMEAQVFRLAAAPSAYRAGAGAAIRSVRVVRHWLELPLGDRPLPEGDLTLLLRLTLATLEDLLAEGPPSTAADAAVAVVGGPAAACPAPITSTGDTPVGPAAQRRGEASATAPAPCSWSQAEGVLGAMAGLAGVNARVLAATRAGLAVNRLRKHPHSGVAAAAAAVVWLWKANVARARVTPEA